MSVHFYRAGILPAGTDRILPPRLAEGQLFYAPLTSSLAAIGGGDVTPSFSRASIATRVNESGLVQSYATGVPRISGSGLFMERASGNVMTYSDDYTDPSWLKYMVGVTPNAIAAPYVGLPTIGAKITETIDNDYHLVYKGYTGLDGNIDTPSAFMKKGERNWGYLIWNDDSTNEAIVWFDLNNGVVGSTALTGVTLYGTPQIEALADGWFRVSFAVITTTQTSRYYGFGPAPSNGVGSYAGTVGYGIHAIGSQMEPSQTEVSSYVPTGSSAVYRLQDMLSYSALGNTPLGPVGSIECVIIPHRIDVGIGTGWTVLSTKSLAEQYGADIVSASLGGMSASVWTNTPQQVIASSGFAEVRKDNSFLFSFRPYDAALYKNGIVIGTTTTNSNLAAHSTITIGASGTTGNGIHGYVREVKVWETRRYP